MSSNSRNHTSRLQQWLERLWYGQSKKCYLLLPFSALYCAVNAFQRNIQTRNLPKLACPVIVVGNITIGGTGKTPLTIHIVTLLKKAGYKPAIITRGYGGKATTWPQSVTADSDARMVGDEAVLMAIHTGVPVYAGANRLESIDQLLKLHDCDVIVSDDGLQHYKLPRDIQIAVIDGIRKLGNGYCLPAGPLREKEERLKDCDMVVINGKDPVNKHAITMSFEGDVLVNVKTLEELPLATYANKKVHAITGIGNPQRFFSSLEKGSLELIEHSFPDHYDFKPADLLFDDDYAVIMTEKDAVKCNKLLSDASKYWYLPVTAKLHKGFDKQLLDLLESL